MSEPLTPDKEAIWRWMILPLRRYAKFSGRSGRREFWWFSAAQFAVYILLFVVIFGGAISGALQADETTGSEVVPGFIGMGIAMVMLTILYLALFIPTLAVTIRRLHDIGISGWVALPLYLAGWFLSIIGWIAYAIVMALPGKDEANQYGPPVYGDQLATVFE